jgi:hypothetical protein
VPLFGTDTSSYQALGSYDPGAYEIINVLDPTLPSKVDRNRNDKRPWGVYSWIFPGEPGSYPVGRAINALAKVGGGTPPLGMWFDYEDGQTPADQWQLVQAFQAADQSGVWSGYYSNDWRVDHQALVQSVGWRPYWMAAYPWANDGNWRNYQASSVRDVQIWQWTSTNGTLDQNAIWDEPWYYKVIGGAVPVPPTTKETPTVLMVNHGVGKIALTDGGIILADWTDPPYGEYGLPQAYLDWAKEQPSSPFFITLHSPDGTMSDLANYLWGQYEQRSAVALQGGGGGGTPAPISDADVQRIAEATADVQAARLKD